MNFVINLLVVLTSLVILFYAFFKKSELGKYSVYVIFGSMLLQELLSVLTTLALFDFLRDILGTVTTFVVYGEIILLIFLVITRLRKSSNKYFKIALVFLIVLKVLQVLGLF
ncbi:hypothetical protein KQ51_01488 [Candidatus Izimaplasma bacterium HR1]|jgi:hypothetical protein|uniref:hypothetical protein n=1 Tax=Candidatus Izimoplasma sp. HR1 TaxID=1541959 RepID=UPI0004F6E484|nr:hypothetical protein KQ51_01488 [Candidatus Izimaplasma bacterium HR1]